MFRLFFAVSILVSAVALRADDSASAPNLLPGDFESGSVTYNRWAGVDGQGNIQVITGSQTAVDDSGEVNEQTFSPSITTGDLNGDGLPDIAVADARGYFWYFPNSGKPNAPVFTHGEIMPIWLGGGEHEGDAVPHLQLVDLSGAGVLSVAAGNYFGGLYFIQNRGSKTMPDFRMPSDRAEVQIQTHSEGLLWCNYLAPFLYDWSCTGRLDLLLGDGSYSANSIFLLENLGSNERPIFNEKKQQKIIAGMGREHLTPQVIDWNNDGNPDVISGERSGYINVYLNKGADKTAPPSFDENNPIHVMFGTSDKVSPFATVCPIHLYHDNLFDLLVGSQDGHISIAQNIGTPGSPKFGPLVPLKGSNQYPKVLAPRTWVIDRYRPDGAPYELLECTNPTIEKDFTPPPSPFKGKGAMKFSIVDPVNVYFKQNFEPALNTRNIKYTSQVYLEANTRYTLSMWVLSSGNISGLTWHMEGNQGIEGGDPTWESYTGSSVGASATWSRVETDVRIQKIVEDNPKRKMEAGSFNFWLQFQGNGTLYLDDISLKKTE